MNLLIKYRNNGRAKFKVVIMRKKGFSLIELLVVVAIVSLLMSVMMPSLQVAKDQAKSVMCKTNLRQIDFGLQMYYEANQAQIPVVYTPPASPSLASELDYCPPWYALLGDMLGWEADKNSPKEVQLSKRNVIHCPSVPRRLSNSTGAREAVITKVASYTTSIYNANKSITEIAKPAKQIFLSDGFPSFFYFNPQSVLPQPTWPR